METSKAGDGLLAVVVVGGGQAGVATAWHLARHHLRYVVLEAGPAVGHTWRSRWDSLTLFTPTQYDALPGMPFPGPAGTYPAKDPVAGYLQAYAAAFHRPVRPDLRYISTADPWPDLRRSAGIGVRLSAHRRYPFPGTAAPAATGSPVSRP